MAFVRNWTPFASGGCSRPLRSLVFRNRWKENLAQSQTPKALIRLLRHGVSLRMAVWCRSFGRRALYGRRRSPYGRGRPNLANKHHVRDLNGFRGRSYKLFQQAQRSFGT